MAKDYHNELSFLYKYPGTVTEFINKNKDLMAEEMPLDREQLTLLYLNLGKACEAFQEVLNLLEPHILDVFKTSEKKKDEA